MHESAGSGTDARTSTSRNYLIAVVCVVIASEALPVPRLLQDLVYSLVGLSVVVAIVVGIRRYRPRASTAWYLMAAGQSLWVVADTTFNWQQDVAHVTAYPTISDVFYLLGYVTFAASLAVLIRGRSGLRSDLGSTLDSAIVTAGLGLLSWVLLARPTIESFDHNPLAAGVAVAYPAMDVVLVGALIRLISSPGGRSPAFRYLLAALSLLIVADTVSDSFNLFATNKVSGVEFLWLLSYAAWGAAVLHPSMRRLSDPGAIPDVRFRGFRLLAVVVATMIAPGILAVEQITGTRLDIWAVVGGSVLIALLVVMRMSLTIERISAVHHSLEVLQDELAVQATHDPLTGLANRVRTMQLIAGALGRSNRKRETVGLLFIDLDGFKEVNDNHGHRAGDEVLRVVAERMDQQIREGDFIGRLGGDEFLVGIEDASDPDDAVQLATRLIAAVSEPIGVDDGVTVKVGASIGIALGRGGLTDVETLLHEADLATYQAKRAGRGRVELFSSTARAALRQHHDIERALADAITRDELLLHFQPIYNLSTGVIDSYEALVRWDRPGVGMVQPDEFLPVAESSDLIYDLDVWVMRAALVQLSRWNRERGDTKLQIAVNVSARHVSQQRIRDDVERALRTAEIDPGQLVVEVTETALMDGSAAADNLEALRAAGVVISLDDFGTGYQSSAQLSRLPIDVLKIDRQFVVTDSDSARSLLELMIKAAHAFGMRVVAEGIETTQQLELVVELGCEYAQGFHLGRPGPAGAQSPEGPPASSVLNPSSSRIGTPSSAALSALDPALSPTTT
ncbi:MAG: Diguanylate cyclase protein [Marmoricola sp.]|nr:Diguanylate cyclase protein [Marmoricola sp.]